MFHFTRLSVARAVALVAVPLQRRHGLHPIQIHVRFVVHKVALEQVFLQYFPRQSISTWVPYSLLHL
jgi:hypothetical protein